MTFEKMLYVHERPDEQWALERALDLAGRVRARVTIAACTGEVSPDLLGAGGIDASRLEEVTAQERRQELEELRTACRGAATSVSSKVLRGRPFVAVIREVAREGHDLVMVPAPERVGIVENFGLSSTAMHLVRKCPVPVWVVRPFTRSLRRIGVAVAAEEEGRRSALDLSLAEAGATVARAFSAKLELFHVLFLHPSEATLRHRAGVGEAQITAIVSAAKSRAEHELRELVRHVSVPAITRVFEGRPAVEIPRFATQTGLDLLIMGTVGRGGIAGLLIGNTAEEILQRVACSVLAIKPADFVTPVV